MWTPQYSEDKTNGFGLGFSISTQHGHRRVGHGGAIYGFSTQLFALPDLKLGVAAVSTVDGTNTITTRISDYALSLMIALKEGNPLPEYPKTEFLPDDVIHGAAGEYSDGERTLVLYVEDDALRLAYGGINGRVKADEDGWVVDDRFAAGTRIVPGQESIRMDDRVFVKQDAPRPSAAPAAWAGLIGEYGWDHNTLYILEEKGTPIYTHRMVSSDMNWRTWGTTGLRFRITDCTTMKCWSLSGGTDGVASQVSLEGGSVFKRRFIEGNEGTTYRITPVRPVEELKEEALAASPPEQSGQLRQPELVDLATLDPVIRFDIRYATENNFMGSVFYDEPRAFLQRPAAEALVRVHQALQEQGFGILVYDAYRPWYVTKMFWDATPDDQKIFVANPANGSRHNRGCAIDLTLYDLETGEPVETPSGYDEFSERAYARYPGGTALERWHREILRDAMEAEGFSVYKYEWWHFDYKGLAGVSDSECPI